MRGTTSLHIVFLDRKAVTPEIAIQCPTFEHNWQEYEQALPGNSCRGVRVRCRFTISHTRNTLI